MELQNRQINFFDGVCHLCNGFVDRVIQLDKRHKVAFAPLQGETAKALLSKDQITKLESIVFCDKGRVYENSEAILRIARLLPFPHSLGFVFIVVPKAFRDLIYNFIAKNRYTWFGQREFCRLPQPQEKDFLLP
ncbi:MAG: thiol-disulfide oxidoreductase DCC family protein [Pseudobdellovibrionaceae bacterium]